jgi:putative membrane protein
MVGQPDAVTAVGMVGVLGLGSVGAYVALRNRRKAGAPV